jgi:hypothetical protein
VCYVNKSLEVCNAVKNPIADDLKVMEFDLCFLGFGGLMGDIDWGSKHYEKRMNNYGFDIGIIMELQDRLSSNSSNPFPDVFATDFFVSKEQRFFKIPETKALDIEVDLNGFQLDFIIQFDIYLSDQKIFNQISITNHNRTIVMMFVCVSFLQLPYMKKPDSAFF